MSDFKMVPLPFDKLENLIPLLYERFEELKERRALVGPDSLHHDIKEGYAMGLVDCYVNDVESPTHLLAFMRVKEFWGNPPVLIVQAIYISKPFRGNSTTLQVMVDNVFKYAEFYGLKRIIAGSPCSPEGKPLSRIWEKAGFVPTQISYSKTL